MLLVQGKIRAGRVRVRLFEDENDKGTALTVVLPSNLGEGLHENIILELA
ncbi:hypothetical protein [Deinococcus peraridilitoris]|nr:hypothetical protein [Deinococcus peraridilitoris]